MRLKTNEFIKRYFDDDLSNEELELYDQVFGDLVYKREQKMKNNFIDFELHSRKSKKFF